MIVDAGGKVVLADVNKEAGDAKAAELGVGARFVTTDDRMKQSAKSAFAAATEMGTCVAWSTPASPRPRRSSAVKARTASNPLPALSTSTSSVAST